MGIELEEKIVIECDRATELLCGCLCEAMDKEMAKAEASPETVIEKRGFKAGLIRAKRIIKYLLVEGGSWKEG